MSQSFDPLDDRCLPYQPILAALAFGEPADDVTLEHLANCEACRAALTEYLQAAHLPPGAIGMLLPSPRLKQRVMSAAAGSAAVQQAMEAQKRKKRWWQRD